MNVVWIVADTFRRDHLGVYGVGEYEAFTRVPGDLERTVQRHPMVSRLFDHSLHVAAGHKGQHHEGLLRAGRRVTFLAEIEDWDDVLVIAEAAHGLRLSRDPLARNVVQPLTLDQRKGNVAVKRGVVGQIDFLLAPFA